MEEDRLTVDMFCFDDAISVNFRPMERPRVRLNASVEEAHVQVAYIHLIHSIAAIMHLYE